MQPDPEGTRDQVHTPSTMCGADPLRTDRPDGGLDQRVRRARTGENSSAGRHQLQHGTLNQTETPRNKRQTRRTHQRRPMLNTTTVLLMRS